MGLFNTSAAPVWPKVVLRKGQVIRDENGDAVCTVTRDCHHGEQFSVGMFEFPEGAQPAPGELIHPAICRAAGLRQR